MKKSLIYIVMALVLASFVLAELSPLDYEELELRSVIDGNVKITQTATDYYVSSVLVSLTWVPHTTFRQEVMKIETEPSAVVNENIEFTWTAPRDKELKFRAIVGTRNFNAFKKIPKKIDFPLQNIEGENLWDSL